MRKLFLFLFFIIILASYGCAETIFNGSTANIETLVWTATVGGRIDPTADGQITALGRYAQAGDENTKIILWSAASPFLEITNVTVPDAES